MKKTKIKITLDEIDKAIKDIDKYKSEILKKEKLFLERLAEIGVKEASVRFTTAMYDGTNSTEVTLDTTDKGYVIIAEGEAVAFIEFGAGVYHNTSEPYPNTRPNGIVGIGEYGAGKGKQRAWGYKDDNGELVITRGNRAAMPMWHASEEMKRAIVKVVREVWS